MPSFTLNSERPRTPDRRLSNLSTDSESSAAERLRWRNVPPLITPNPELVDSNPFEDLNLTKGKTEDEYQHINDEKTSGDSADAEKSDYDEINAARGNTRDACGERGGKEHDWDGVKDEKGHRNTPGGERENDEKKKLSWRERIRHFTWTWFCMTMATGGIANVLYTLPFRFRGLYALGSIFFILNIVLFLFNTVMISCRFYFFPKTFKASFLHPTESLFIPASVISFGTILINISQYGVETAGPWLEKCMVGLFWADCGLAVLFSIGIYLIMWSTQTFTISQMTPVWIFPAYPLLIIGPHAGNLAPKVSDPNKALAIILTGYVIQGVGFLVSLMIYSAYIYRLMTQKLPKESLRPGMFISVGPSGFTIAGVVLMGQQLPKIVPKDFMGEGMGDLAGNVGKICANFLGLWLWGLALWFFLISVGAHWSCATRGKMDFAMTWYSFIFPNTALTTATFAIARALNGNKPIQYIGCAMTILLVITWIFVFLMMIRAVVIKQILWPQKQEDRTEGGFKQQSSEEQRRRGWDGTGHGDGGEGGEHRLGRVWSLRRSLSKTGRAPTRIPGGDGSNHEGRRRGYTFTGTGRRRGLSFLR